MKGAPFVSRDTRVILNDYIGLGLTAGPRADTQRAETQTAETERAETQTAAAAAESEGQMVVF